jgi:3-oxoacyl-[acyl-carrier-protein] synthase II
MQGKAHIAITGIGLVSAHGTAPDTCFEQLSTGRSGIGRVPADLGGRSELSVAGLIHDFDPGLVVGNKSVRRTSRYQQLAIAAARSARADAGLTQLSCAVERCSAIVASVLGGCEYTLSNTERYTSHGLRGLSPYIIPAIAANMASGLIAIEAGAKGPCYSPAAMSASSGVALAQSLSLLRDDTVDVAIAGGAEGIRDQFVLALLATSKQLSCTRSDSPTASRPFDRGRSGIVPSEGAAVLMLERLSDAKARGSKIYAELSGYGLHYATSNAPDSRANGMELAMREALRSADISAADVGFVCAYAAGTQESDRIEASAIKRVFGKHADQLSVSSSKGALGVMLGASSSYDVAMTALALSKRLIPPTLNLDDRDPDCDLDIVVQRPRPTHAQYALTNSFSESGHFVSLIVKRADDLGASARIDHSLS